jgi:omega-amidase
MQDLTITLVQTSLFWEDPEANISNFEKLLDGIDTPTDLIILPEMFNTGFTMAAKQNAEMMDGRSIQWMADTAKSKQNVVCGSLIIKEDNKYYNRLIWMRPDGSFEHYDKKHLFRMGEEHLHFDAGNEKLITEIKGWKIMPLICYDLRFPVWSKNTYKEEKYAYDVLIYVANWPAVRAEAWTSLIKGRAIENLAYAIGVNRIGTDGRGYEYSGDSLVAAPWGKQISATRSAVESTSTLILKAAELKDIRNKIGVGKDWDD